MTTAFEWLPEPGQTVDLLAVGRSGEELCARLGTTSVHLLVAGTTRFEPVPGELFTVAVSRRGRQGGLWRLEGSVQAPRLDVAALGVEALELTRREGEAGGSEVADREVAHFELESLAPRIPRFPYSGAAALDEIAAFWSSGDGELAEMLVGELLARDLRYLDAHALLGGFYLDGPLEERWTERALRHYRVGVAIGELSLGTGFEGRLPWRWAGNRGFLRCLYGQARCLDRLGESAAAWHAFRRLLRLAPEDPLEVREMLREGR